VIIAGDIFHVRYKGDVRTFIILTSPDPDDDKVLYILEGNVNDPLVDWANELEKAIYGEGSKFWSCGERVTNDELKRIQDEVLEAKPGKYYTKYIHRYRIKWNR
jgi:hypothetical protein